MDCNTDMHADFPIPERLTALRRHLVARGVDLYLQPMGDEFQGEYIPACAARLPYISGFTGSAGLGAFWADAARQSVIFVDGRYSLQAASELEGSGLAACNSGAVSLAAWLREQRARGVSIAYDPWLVTRRQLHQWQQATAALDVRWEALRPNPVDAIWPDRPAAPQGAVRLHLESLSGASYAQKRAALIAAIEEKSADGCMLTLPDGINWLLNIRGDDIPFNPLLLAYFRLMRNGQGTLYVFNRTFSKNIEEYLNNNDIIIEDISSIFLGEKNIAGAATRLLIDPATAAEGWWQLAEQQGWEIVEADDPTLLPKACKNAVELEGIRAAHRRDGLALCRLLHWFDTQIEARRFPDELTVVRALEAFRMRDEKYRGASFATIAGSGPHGAIVHYRADAASNRRAAPGELFLLDSGGQYDDGTTDVTRTLPVGPPTDAMREHYTCVLQGHIALARAVFPPGTCGMQLDALARQYLWRAGLDYDHGTGHGVGAYLCVHEGPQRISKKGSAVALQPGMVLSNEPGYYAAGAYGIRIENLVAVVTREIDGRPMLGFETLTLAPIDTRLIQIAQLGNDERNWLNDYHQRVYKTHESALDAATRDWLARATRAV